MSINKSKIITIGISGNGFVLRSFDWLYYNGHLTAMRPVAILMAMMLIHEDKVSLPTLGIAYLITLIVYSNDRVRDLGGDRVTNPDRSAYLSRKKKNYHYLFALYLGSLVIILLLFADAELLVLAVYAMVAIAIGVLYTTALKRVTKYVPGFKTILVASEWAATIVLLYGVFYHSLTSVFALMFGAFAFIKLFNSSLFFDIKDIESDGLQGLKTIPVIMGYKSTLRILKVLVVVSFLPLVIGVFGFGQPVLALLLLPLSVIFYGMVRIAEANEGVPLKYYIPAHLEYMIWPLGVIIGAFIISTLR